MEGHHAEVKELEGIIKMQLNDEIIKKALNEDENEDLKEQMNPQQRQRDKMHA